MRADAPVAPHPRVIAGSSPRSLPAAAADGRIPCLDVKDARLAAPEAVVTRQEWVHRALADSELSVERVSPSGCVRSGSHCRRLPRGVVGKDGRAEVRIRLLIDTLGVADMRTFNVVNSLHPTPTRSVRAAVGMWKFVPAEVGGSKVPRNFDWDAVGGDRTAESPR